MEEGSMEEKGGEIQRNREGPAHYKVLVVDDQELMGKLIADLLSRFGHECKIVRSGTEALDRMRQDRFDAVITDIVMPEMDGLALARELRNLYPRLPVTIMTGHGNAYPEESARLAGARDFIMKSFSIDEFILRFNRMMHDPVT